MPGNSMPMEPVMMDWCAPPSGASVMPDGVPTTMNLRAGIKPVIKRVQPARHETIVKRADGKEQIAIDFVRQAKLAERHEQIDFGNAQFDVLAGGGFLPGQDALPRLLPAEILFPPGSKRPFSLIQPPRLVELATSGLTVTMRLASSGNSRAMEVRILPKICCVERLPA